MKVDISSIRINDRKRKLNADKVAELAESILLLGLLEPILVAQNGDKYTLLAGLHRLEAAKLLGWKTIEAALYQGDDLECELVEIDENLINNDLTVLEQGEHIQRRNEILEAMGKRATPKDNQYAISAHETVSWALDHRPDRWGTMPPLKTTEDIAKEVGLSKRSAQQRTQIARDIVPEVKELIRDTPIADSTTQLLELARMKPDEQLEVAKQSIDGEMNINQAITEVKRKQIVQQLENVEVREAKAIEGVYDVIVIDPPWPMKKIEREVAPEQVEFEYPTMTIDEIKELEIPCADDCHVWLWTTHKYLPDALDILKVWDMKYVCTFVWHKPGGFQPFGLPQFNAEFALYARRGSPKFVDFTDFKLCFDAPRTGHSEKPELFYDLVRRVTAGRRLFV